MHPGAKRPRRPISDDSEENSSHVLRDDLRTVIDNLGQTPSDRGTTPGPSSVLEVSLKQITYRDRNPVRAQSEDPRALNRGGLVHRIDCPQHSSNSSEEASYQCCCCYNSDESDETSAGIAQIRPDTPRYQTDSEQAAATGGIPETRIIEERRTLQPCYNYESVNRYHRNHIGVHRHQTPAPETSLEKIINFFRFRRRGNNNGTVNRIFGNWYSNNGKRNDCGCTESGLPKPNSGTLLPQLYTANVKNTVGAAAPERFTFNAITGIPDYKLVENISNNVSKPHKMRVQSSPALGANQAAPYNESLYSPQSLPGKVSKENLAPRADRHNVNYFHLKQDYSVFHPPPERIDVYCFDHQNAGFFQTTDNPPPIHTEFMIEKMETFSSNFWAEIFGFIHIFINFIMAFIMQFFKFLLFTIVRPLMVGILQLASDYFWKPFLTILFNGIFQPVIIFFYNLATSLRDLALPVAQGMGYFLREFAVLIRAFRLVDVKNSINNGPFTLPQ